MYLEGQTEGEGEKGKKNSDDGSSWRFLAVDPLQEAASSCLRQQMANHVATPTLVQSELSFHNCHVRPISSSHLLCSVSYYIVYFRLEMVSLDVVAVLSLRFISCRVLRPGIMIDSTYISHHY